MEQNYSIVRSKRRTIAIHIDAFGNITVKAPLLSEFSQIQSFIAAKQSWIASKTQQLKKRAEQFQDVVCGKFLLCFGAKYEICIDKNVAKPAICGKQLLLPGACADECKKAACLKKWTSCNASQYLQTKLPAFSQRMQLFYGTYRLSNAKCRWGSCDNNKRLSFNWRVGMLPPELIDYIIVHELSHLSELNHSKRFWSIVQQYVPNYRALQIELKQYSFLTHC